MLSPGWMSWFAGLVDGEGYFGIRVQGAYCDTVLAIKLREDDRPLLDEIKRTLGIGKVYSVSRRGSRERGMGTRDQVMWRCHRVSETSRVLVPLFDTHSLRSKKRQDYELWREATMLLANYGYGASGVRDRIRELDALQRKARHDGLIDLANVERINSIPLQPMLFADLETVSGGTQ